MIYSCSESPSRLKGIETFFPFSLSISSLCSESPSRLKGIETNSTRILLPAVGAFGKSFPFEGN